MKTRLFLLGALCGGTALSTEAWPVTLTDWHQSNLEVVRGETGVWLKVSSGMLIVVR